MAVQRINKLEKLVSEMVGDDGKPNLFFVTLGGQCILISRDLDIAHRLWRQISNQRTQETTLEDRQTGVICSNGPEEMEDGSTQWAKRDDTRMHGFKPTY